MRTTVERTFVTRGFCVSRGFSLAASLMVVFALGSAKPLAGQGWTGQYQLMLPTGAATLEIIEAGGNVTGSLRTADGTTYQLTGSAVDSNQGPALVGRATGPALTGFAFQAMGNTYQFSFAPLDPSGVPRIDPNLVFTATRLNSAAPSTQPTTPTESSGDARFLGLWSTQVMMNSEVGSIATELLMRFDPDGRLYDLGSRSIGLGMETGGGTGGGVFLWRAVGDVLQVSEGTGIWAPLAQFTFVDGRLHLFYPHDASRQVWSRVQ